MPPTEQLHQPGGSPDSPEPSTAFNPFASLAPQPLRVHLDLPTSQPATAYLDLPTTQPATAYPALPTSQQSDHVQPITPPGNRGQDPVQPRIPYKTAVMKEVSKIIYFPDTKQINAGVPLLTVHNNCSIKSIWKILRTLSYVLRQMTCAQKEKEWLRK